ncbi:MAG: Verru_Chthon cassette protein D, partial [Spartobacteria bacterium]
MTSPASAHPGRTVPKANSPAGLSVLLKKSPAFSLIELLVVIAIIGILAAAAIGGLSNVARSTNLTSAAQRLGDQFALARQTAVARNLPVEVRIYKLPDYDATTGGATLWRGLQLFIKDGSTDVPASRPLFFPQRVIISENAQASPLLSDLGAELTPPSNV